SFDTFLAPGFEASKPGRAARQHATTRPRGAVCPRRAARGSPEPGSDATALVEVDRRFSRLDLGARTGLGRHAEPGPPTHDRGEPLEPSVAGWRQGLRERRAAVVELATGRTPRTRGVRRREAEPRLGGRE